MNFEVYCDESHQDLINKKIKDQYLMIGSLWVPAELRQQIKIKIYKLRELHSVWGEIKWIKISNSKLNFYLDLINLFFNYRQNLRFRCIAVSADKIDLSWHNNDGELGFYKFYYQLLHHWILDFNTYTVFCDIKTDRDPSRLKVLMNYLQKTNLTAKIAFIQALSSHEVVLIQLTDLLLGAVSAKLNNTLRTGSAKWQVVSKLEQLLEFELKPTLFSETKYNVFKINLQEGW